MEVGIGLPSTIPGTGRHQVLEWARRAEARGFSTLGTIDRIVYPSHDPLIALAAAAGVTERIRLATAILLAPTRANGAVLAKQAATLDVLSERAPRARRGRRAPRGRLRVRRRRLPRARPDPRRDARAVGPDLGRRGFGDGRRDRPAGARRPPSAPRSAASRAPRSPAPRATPTAGPPATARWRSSPTGPRACGPRGRPPGATARRGRWRSRTTRSATVRSRRSTAACATTTGRGRDRHDRGAGRDRRPGGAREHRAFAAAGCDELIFFP